MTLAGAKDGPDGDSVPNVPDEYSAIDPATARIKTVE